MTEKNKGKDSRNLLKNISKILMVAGIIMFFAGFMLQFISIATMSGRSFAAGETPNNFFAVIVAGFALLFSGVMVGAVDSMNKAKDINQNMFETISDKVMKGMHERMCEPVEKYCEYCGTPLNEGERECPNCGASKTKKE